LSTLLRECLPACLPACLWMLGAAYTHLSPQSPLPCCNAPSHKRRLTLEKEVDDKEDANEIFDLKKTKMDNLFYFGYGEWATVTDFVDHLRSDWFMDFAEVRLGLYVCLRAQAGEAKHVRTHLPLHTACPAWL